MIWDFMCKSLEIIGSEPFMSWARQAKLFVIEGEQTPELIKTVNPTNEELDAFFLPYPVVAVEDGVSCVLMADTEENQIGAHTPRVFIECLPTQEQAIRHALQYEEVNRMGYTESEVLACYQSLRNKGILSIISIGTIELRNTNEPTTGKRKWNATIGQTTVICVFENGHVEHMNDPSFTSTMGKAAITCMEEIIYFNNPERFIMEKSPVKYDEQKAIKKPKIARSHERPIYTLLKPHQIREKMGIEEPAPGTRASPRPHERRRHLRTLRSDRYKFAKGKVITIPASWIGPTEAKIGKHYYRVVLDK